MWPWRVLVDERWTTLGSQLANSKSYLPGSFERAPRNIAEKYNSGYKTWEFTLAFYGMGPAFLLDVLPEPYYDNYTKLVFGARLRDSRTVSFQDIREAHIAQVEAHRQFEELYYQGNPARLNYCRQSLHNCSHGAPEIVRVGRLSLLSQYPLERTIGDLGRQIRNFQGDKMYTNFANMGWRQVQINALFSIYPGLAPKDKVVSPKDIAIGGGFYLLRRGSDKTARLASTLEGEAIMRWLEDNSLPDVFVNPSSIRIARWARVRLPNGQIVRSLWKEQLASDPRNIRMARNVKVSLSFVLLYLAGLALIFCT
jgi:hypothetical protein